MTHQNFINELNSGLRSRTIFCKDNLEVLRCINSNCIDMIYLDPPFNTNKDYHKPTGPDSASGAKFSDIFREEHIKKEWVKSIDNESPTLHDYLMGVVDFSRTRDYCYLVYMAVRLLECKRILKFTGSIFLHCDSTMNSYLRIVLDCIFGAGNFRNQITWKRMSGNKSVKNKYPENTDSILYYAKSKEHAFKPLYHPVTNEELEELKKGAYKQVDEKGRHFTLSDLTKPDIKGYHYEYEGYKPNNNGWRCPLETMREYDRKGVLFKPENKNRRLRRINYLSDYKGRQITNLWDDIGNVQKDSDDTNYPTKKPIPLLKRIIESSTERGDIVLDPFCGCATTCVAAEYLNRKWIGIDVSHAAYQLVCKRMQEPEFGIEKTLIDKPEQRIVFTTELPELDVHSSKDEGYVYIMENIAWKGWYKIGVSKQPKKRLSGYQTSDPNRGYKLILSHPSRNYGEIEKYIHNRFKAKGEWVYAELTEIKKAIKDWKPE